MSRWNMRSGAPSPPSRLGFGPPFVVHRRTWAGGALAVAGTSQVHRTSSESRPPDRLQHVLRGVGGHVDVRHRFANVDRTDVAPGEAGLVGDGADDVRGADAVPLADRHRQADLPLLVARTGGEASARR